jgi:hypothetical protein
VVGGHRAGRPGEGPGWERLADRGPHRGGIVGHLGLFVGLLTSLQGKQGSLVRDIGRQRQRASRSLHVQLRPPRCELVA